MGFILNKLFGAVVKGHMMRAVDHAYGLGVPRDFSLPTISEVTMISKVVKDIGKQVPEFREEDVYKQYGMALKLMYDAWIDNQKVQGKLEVSNSVSDKKADELLLTNDSKNEKSNLNTDDYDYQFDSLIEWADKSKISEPVF